MFDEVSNALREGKTNEDIYQMLLERGQKAKAVSGAEIGLSAKEKKQYSFIRAIQASYTKNWDLAPFEREVSQACADHMKQEARGFFVPMDILADEATRTMQVDTANGSTAGQVVETNLMVSSMIELIRKRLILHRLGARFLTGLRGNIAIPKVTGGAVTYFVPESGDTTASDPTFSQISMSPKTISGMTVFSRLLTLQSSIGVEAFVRSDIAAAIAEGIEKAVFFGTGSANQPLGLLGQTGLHEVTLGTNGGALTYDDVVEMETLVADSDIYDDGTMKYLVNARTRGKLKTTLKFPYGSVPVFEKGARSGDQRLHGTHEQPASERRHKRHWNKSLHRAFRQMVRPDHWNVGRARHDGRPLHQERQRRYPCHRIPELRHEHPPQQIIREVHRHRQLRAGG